MLRLSRVGAWRGRFVARGSLCSSLCIMGGRRGGKEIVGLNDGGWGGGLRGCRSIDLVDLVGLVASVAVVLACHGSGGRADGLRWIAARARGARTVEV